MSGWAAIYLAQYFWIEFHRDPDAVIIGPGPEFYILPPVGLMAVSGLAAFMLITDMKGQLVRLFEYAALLVWSLVTVGIVFGAMVSASEADMRGQGIEDFFPQYLLAYALTGVNGVMYFFLHEAHTIRFSYDIRIKSAISAISIASIGGFVIIAITYVVLLQNPDLSYSMTGHLPDSFLSQPVRDSPEGRAFLARYPDSEIIVFQLFDQPDCCEVTLSYLRNSTETCITNEIEYWCGSQGPGATLRTQVNISSDLKNIAVTKMSLSCSAQASGGQPAHWTVKGDIAETLRPENPDCWDIGPSLDRPTGS
jgi:hypothetical protein